MPSPQPHQRSLILALIVSIVIGFVPILKVLMFPIDYLDTHFHELGHALAAITSASRARSSRAELTK